MSFSRQIAVAGVVFALWVSFPTVHRADEPAAAKSDAAATKDAQPAATGDRDEKAVVADLRDAKEKLTAAMPSISSIGDAEFRKESGEKVVPLIRRAAELLNELAALEKDDEVRQGLQDDRRQFLALLVALGDNDATAALEKDAAATDVKDPSAKLALILGRWWKNSKDAAAQEKILGTVVTMAKADPSSEKLLQALEIMARVGAANDELAIKVVQVIRKTMTGDTAKRIAAELDPNGGIARIGRQAARCCRPHDDRQIAHDRRLERQGRARGLLGDMVRAVQRRDSPREGTLQDLSRQGTRDRRRRLRL